MLQFCEFQMTEVTKCSCWHQNFVPKGLSAPTSGLYTCIKSWKNCIKSDSKRFILKLEANDRSDKRFLLTSKFCPLGVVCPWLMVTSDQSDKTFLLSSKKVSLPELVPSTHALGLFPNNDHGLTMTIFISPAKQSFRGVYWFQHVRESEIPSTFNDFPVLFKFTSHHNHPTMHVW